MAELQHAWGTAGQMIVVRGSAGIGKSRIARELATWANGQGGTTLAGRCSATASDMPLRPFRELLLAGARSGLRPPDGLAPFLPALGSLVPEWAASPGVVVDSNSVIVAEGVLRLTAAWSEPATPTLVVIEDAHWSDRETLDVLEYLADNLRAYPILVVVTVRGDEPGPGNDVIDGLIARRAVQLIDLFPLSERQSEVMVRECLHLTTFDTPVVDAVISRSDGVPFFIEELLASTLEDTKHEVTVPASVTAALDVRLSSLPGTTVQFLRYASLLGRQFDWRVAASAVGCAEDEALDRLRVATRAQLIDPEGDGFRFRHALTADAVQSSLLPDERRAIAVRLLRELELLHPDLEGERCQLAASLAFVAGEHGRGSELWVEAARRALKEGSLGSAEQMALRAKAERPLQADRILLSTWTAAGQPRRALEAGSRILAAEVDETLAIDVRLELVNAMFAAGRWDDADNFLSGVRTAACLDAGHQTLLAVAEAELALGRNDTASALTFARCALADADEDSQPEAKCRALEIVGRIERGRDTAAALESFERAHSCAARHGLALFRIRALQELATIDMFETLSTDRLEEARRDALSAGALATAATVDLQLAATYSCQGQTELTVDSAIRCEEVSRQFGLATLPMSLAQQAVGHGIGGNRPAMEAVAEEAYALKSDVNTVNIVIWSNGVATYHIGEGQLHEALDALERSMEVFRDWEGTFPFPGRWALLRTVLDIDGADAREECRRLPSDTPMSRETLWAADAVAAGRENGDASSLFAQADAALARYHGGFLRGLTRLLVAPCAQADGWGQPGEWLREALVWFETLELANFAGQCRSALRAMGEPVPRRAAHKASRVPSQLAAQGVTTREAEVLAQLAAGCSNRDIANSLHVSVRTVEKHVERLLMKTGRSRPELAQLAKRVGVQPPS
jgi:DNA-binding CsgD family transcriptional regulator